MASERKPNPFREALESEERDYVRRLLKAAEMEPPPDCPQWAPLAAEVRELAPGVLDAVDAGDTATATPGLMRLQLLDGRARFFMEKSYPAEAPELALGRKTREERSQGGHKTHEEWAVRAGRWHEKAQELAARFWARNPRGSTVAAAIWVQNQLPPDCCLSNGNKPADRTIRRVIAKGKPPHS